MKIKFVSGVIEGFYGRPWSTSQRLELFQRLEYMGLNTYLYAPKDDMKHRQRWRDLYSKEETIQLKFLIDASKKHNVVFVYAISPGVDIIFSNSNDIFLLKQKMQQVLDLGCEAFSLLFDDISPNLSNVDQNYFLSLATAQVTLTNEIFEALKEPTFFLFCPTEYCATRAVPNVLKSEYLATIGRSLKSDIDIMWTGPKVISKFITLESILELSEVLKRPPVIWDNIHANDYDQKRLFLGPYCGRSPKLIPHIRGILTNPNCEFEANFIAMHTLAQWVKSDRSLQNDIHRGSDNIDSGYEPSEALRLALIDWLDILYQTKYLPNEYNNSLNCSSTNESISSPTVILLPHNPPIISCVAPQGFCVEQIESKVTQIINITSTSLAISDSKEESTEDAISQENAVITISPLSPVIDEPASTQIENNNETLKLGDKVNNQCEMEIIDNGINIFPLTPMETEDNQSDAENVVDPMAMQVDSVDEGETMEVIEGSTAKTYRENSKESLSSHSEESEMGDTISNASIDVSCTTIDKNLQKLTIDDLNLLVHIFFLPYEHGPLAVKILEMINWIRCHSHLVDKRYSTCTNDAMASDVEAIEEWHIKAKEFDHQVTLVRNLVDKMCNIPNRNVLFDLYPYIEDLRHVLATLNSYVKWIGCTPGCKESFMTDDHEPWVFRGGLISEFQRMFPLEGSNDLFPNHALFDHMAIAFGSPLIDSDNDGITEFNYVEAINEDIHLIQDTTTDGLAVQPSIFIIRPFSSPDKNNLYTLCGEILFNQLRKDSSWTQTQLNELLSFKDLAGDRYLGYFIQFCPNNCFVLENDQGRIIGYAFGSSLIKEIFQFRKEVYFEQMKIKYASHYNSLSNPNDIQPGVKTLMEGFFNEKLFNQLPEVEDQPNAFIHLDIIDCCKDTTLDTIISLSRRLLLSLCSTLNVSSLKDKSVSEAQKELPKEDSHCTAGDLNGDSTNNDSVNIEISLKRSMVAFCEVDSLNKSYIEFCERLGFSRCYPESEFVPILIMSKCVSI